VTGGSAGSFGLVPAAASAGRAVSGFCTGVGDAPVTPRAGGGGREETAVGVSAARVGSSERWADSTPREASAVARVAVAGGEATVRVLGGRAGSAEGRDRATASRAASPRSRGAIVGAVIPGAAPDVLGAALGARDGSMDPASADAAGRAPASTASGNPGLSVDGRGALAGQSRVARDAAGPAASQSRFCMGRRAGAFTQSETDKTTALAATATTSQRRTLRLRRRAQTSQRIASETAAALQSSSWRHRP
jgi:hypothetical protein